MLEIISVRRMFVLGVGGGGPKLYETYKIKCCEKYWKNRKNSTFLILKETFLRKRKTKEKGITKCSSYVGGRSIKIQKLKKFISDTRKLLFLEVWGAILNFVKILFLEVWGQFSTLLKFYFF